ncbi:alpha/beta hydrolase [Pseudoclavibacter chungangensis]|uniref:Alpha/beta hydrolase n=1 Tax=Pseudoclavibacter chungangensis TaxID=587635 RepID=A0A7J5BNS2_9MICO|nr:alpha/beta hydrolase [Pseudoclavibacter chungangensis]KAB1653833.1 alpha/beta hydrolase [Pseudoclavibacter chungangensis]
MCRRCAACTRDCSRPRCSSRSRSRGRRERERRRSRAVRCVGRGAARRGSRSGSRREPSPGAAAGPGGAVVTGTVIPEPEDGHAIEEISVLGPRGRSIPVVLHSWPVESPRAVVHIAHGAGEHAGRYAALAADLNAAGYAVTADDHLGHGRTGRAGDSYGRLGEGQNRTALDALVQVVEEVRHRDQGLPLVLFGHSWGSLLAQQLLARRSRLLDALVLSGTTLAVPGYLNGGDLDGAFQPDSSGVQWLSRDPEVQAAFITDPLTFDIGADPVWNTLGKLQLLHLPPSSWSARVDDVPVLVMGGSEDSIGFGARGPRALARVYRRRTGLSDVTHIVYEGARHEIVNETNRDEVVADLVHWLDTRFPRR